MKLNLALPGLLWPDQGDLEYIYANLNIGNLNQLVKRATLNILPFGYSELIYPTMLNLTHGSLAYQLACQLNVSNDYSTFLIAEPTHLRVDRDRLLISEAEILQLNENEADTIINAINTHFNQEIHIYYINSHLWLIGLNLDLSEEQFYPILDIIGENIDNYLPKGANSIEFSRILNEIQMLLHNLSINEIRQNDGLLMVNSLWLWDRKITPNIKSHFNNIIMGVDDQIIKDPQRFASNDLVIIDKLYYPSCYRDHYAWQNNLEMIDKVIAAPLSELYISGVITQLNIFVPGNTQTLKLTVNRLSRYKFWQRYNLINLSRK